MQVVFNNTQQVCHRCWQRTNAVLIQRPAENIQDEQGPAENIQDDVIDEQGPAENFQDDSVRIQDPAVQNFQQFFYAPEHVRAPNSARRCIFNYCHNIERHRIPNAIIVNVLCSQRLYIPENARVCTDHLESNEWHSLRENCNVSHEFNVAHFTDMSNILISAVNRRSRFDFELLESLGDNDIFFWTGLTIAQFNTVLEETPSLTQTVNRSRTVIGVYLSKLRTGESNERLATLFNMSRRTLERKLALARIHLVSDFVSIHLGMDNISRQNMLQKNLFLPKMIYGNEENTKAIVICDGTYVYIEKSSNFLFQRLTYSHHKFQNLLKPFLMVCSDGYIIDVLGPYAATTSDASIMTSLCANEDNPFHWMFHQNDVFILDRGFRDSVVDLQSLGYEPHIPPTKDRNESQLTTEQANKARLVTICRWVVEAVNGKFKNRFKLLRQDYFNRALPHMFVDFKIAASLINAFYKVATDHRLSHNIWNIINEKINSPNLLFNYVTLKNLNRQRVAFIRMEANLPHLEDFPQLTEDDILMISLGSYQMKLARSYASENLRDGGVCVCVTR